MTISLKAWRDSKGEVGGPRARPQASTCFDTLHLPAWTTTEQVGEGMSDLLAQKSFSCA